jgi:hypothetical protein
MRKRLLAVLSTPALTLAVAFAPAAHAASAAHSHPRPLTLVAVVCTGTDTTNYKPGLLTTSQTVDTYGTDTGSGCLGVDQVTGLDSFTASFTGQYTASCIAPIQSGSGTEVLTWNDGTTSTWSWSSTVATNEAGQLVGTYDGPITTGRYAGANLNNTDVEPDTDVTACLAAPGLTQTTGIATWTFAEV